MKALNILNKILFILNIVIGSILLRKCGDKICLLFWGSILLGGIEGIIFSNLYEEGKNER
ncbi:MAG: hypothetical protein IJA94_06620 [Bacilli bacterium]|nr:hypothetical protein [Bacilli bacterium]MBQ3415299.1 hypothetical protein [Clostridia bacterium]MBQ4584544.1 hypothetical protein [Bacilli bacterium]MBR0058203.1 hypothetical protein [Methanobrevibacter sp.]MBR0371549.1 hypothetical protein [Methanobrevibacter sp.]